LKRLLEAQRRRYQSAAETAKQAIKEDQSADLDQVADVAERSEADVREDVDLALFALRNEMLEETERALIQLGAGQYGRCIECGTEIAPDRLEALPAATRCWPCEEAHEAVSDRQSAAQTGHLARELSALRRATHVRPPRRYRS
jgi:RNA polymerase-binding transcription factor DksA